MAVALPVGVAPPASLGLALVGRADLLRILGIAHRYRHLDPDAERQWTRTRSRGWRDDEDRPAGAWTVEGASVLTVEQAREVLDGLGIARAIRVPEAAEAVAWTGGRGQQLAVSLLLRGEDAPSHITAASITRLAGWWLATIPVDVGDGPAVAEVLRRDMWYGPRVGAADALREADAADRVTRNAIAEAAGIRAGIMADLARDLTASLAAGAPVGLVAEVAQQPYGVIADIIPSRIRADILAAHAAWEVCP